MGFSRHLGHVGALIGWPFIENVELHLISSAFGLAMLQRGAPTRRASAIFCARDFTFYYFISKIIVRYTFSYYSHLSTSIIRPCKY